MRLLSVSAVRRLIALLVAAVLLGPALALAVLSGAAAPAAG